MVFAVIKEQQANGVSGGDFNSGSWVVRQLNVITSDLNNLIVGGTITAGRFILDPGYYLFEGFGAAFKVDSNQLRIYNVTATAAVEVGDSAFTSNGAEVSVKAGIVAPYRVTVRSSFELQHQATTTKAANGLGVDAGFGTVNTYAVLKITVVGK